MFILSRPQLLWEVGDVKLVLFNKISPNHLTKWKGQVGLCSVSICPFLQHLPQPLFLFMQHLKG